MSFMMFCLRDRETDGDYENLCLVGCDVMEASHLSKHIEVSHVLYPEVITANMSSLKIIVFSGTWCCIMYYKFTNVTQDCTASLKMKALSFPRTSKFLSECILPILRRW
jgi:hypothetical protein